MFTGIIETTGTITFIQQDDSNKHFIVQSPISGELTIDQSVSHNGVCLTVVEVNDGTHMVTAVEETLKRSNLGQLKMGDVVNLERCLKIGDRLDGHMVQGHVDTTAQLISAKDANGSFLLTFEFDKAHSKYLVNKGSITVNGISLTVVEVESDPSSSDTHNNRSLFSVAIIPYTWEHTNLSSLQPGDTVNLEFDVIGKYVEKMLMNRG